MITKLIAAGDALTLLAGCTTAHADRELIYTPDKVMSPKTSYTGKARVKGGLDGVKRLWIDAHGFGSADPTQLIAPQDKVAKAAAVGTVKRGDGLICGTFEIERETN